MNSLKVAHLLDCFLSISEVFIYELIRSLDEVQNCIIARQFRNIDLYPFEPLYRCDGNGNRWVGRALNLFSRKDPDDLAGAEPILREVGADVIHAHFGLLGARALFLKRRLDLPFITSFYGVDASKQAREPQYRKEFRDLFEGGDLFLAEGSAMKCRLIDLGCPHEKIRIQHLGVDVDRFEYVQRRAPAAGESLRVLFCGRFVEKKGLLDALRAVKLTLENGTALEFRVIGDGPMRMQVEAFIEENYLSPYVRLLGMLDHEAYHRELLSAHLLLQPSRTASDGDTEGGAPTVLLEAQATGLPVVSTTHADIPEYVQSGAGGILVREGDVEGMAHAMVSLIGNSEARRRMGMLGRIHVVENYHIKNESCRLADLYREVSA